MNQVRYRFYKISNLILYIEYMEMNKIIIIIKSNIKMIKNGRHAFSLPPHVIDLFVII